MRFSTEMAKHSADDWEELLRPESDETVVCCHAGQGHGLASASGLGEAETLSDFGGEVGRDGEGSESAVTKAAVSGFGTLSSGKNGSLP
jgi:hypothetical protein